MSEENPSGWAVGWSIFAATMLILAGTLQFLNGLVGLFNDEFFVRTQNYTFEFDITAWAWFHLLLGVVVFCSGLGILKGHVLGRTVGVFVAGLALIANFMWLPYYPIWSIVIMTMNIAIIWALTAHGRDITAAR